MHYVHTTTAFYTSIHRVRIHVYKALYGLQRIHNDITKPVVRSIYTYIGLADGKHLTSDYKKDKSIINN
jgi:hypothetical protein